LSRLWITGSDSSTLIVATDESGIVSGEVVGAPTYDAVMSDAIDYRTPGPLTDLDGVSLDGLPHTAIHLCRLAPGLILHPAETGDLGLPDERLREQSIRPARRILEVMVALDDAPLTVAREPERRVVGTCRHFAVFTCALLRRRGVAARARCGFATYFQPGKGVDHWVTEYWDDDDRRWVRIDSQVLGGSVLDRPEDLAPGEFLTGGEAWAAFRDGRLDADTYGVGGTENWGPAEIRGNAIRDLASLNKVEMLPWDEWGRMDASYRGETGSDYDELLDTVAAACGGDDAAAMAALYRTDELTVPGGLMV
jgi:hypothetical protein